MAGTEPRAFLRFIVDEWPVIDAIYERTADSAIRPHVLRQLAGDSGTPNLVARLLELGIISQLPNSPDYEMSEFVRDLIEQLKREHSLGLAEELRVYLQDLDEQKNAVMAAIEEADQEKLHRHAARLDRRIKTIQRQVRQNSEAVNEIVSRAKTRKRYTPLHQRYGEVLEAWESYVEPLRSMVDPAGPFEALFERLERELHRAGGLLSSSGKMVAERRRVEILLYRLMELRGQLKTHLGETSEHLLPLVREIRRNSTVARGASIAVKALLDNGPQVFPAPELIPISRRRLPNAVSSMDQIEAFLAELGNYKPEPQPFVSIRPGDAEEAVHLDPQAVAERLREALPVDDLLEWLIAEYEDTADLEDILNFYFMLEEENQDLMFVKQQPANYQTVTHHIRARQIQVDTSDEN